MTVIVDNNCNFDNGVFAQQNQLLGSYRLIQNQQQATWKNTTWAETIKKIKPELDKELDDKDLHDLSKGKLLTNIPNCFLEDVINFTNYLENTSHKTFTIYGELNGSPTKPREIPYIHRWTVVYRRGILAKLYQLEAAIGNDISDIEFITLTIPHKKLDQEETLLQLRRSYTKLMDLLRHIFNVNGAVDYFYIIEPHKSGHPHIHILYMKKFTLDQKKRVTRLWADKYCDGVVGVREHGLTFAKTRASKSGDIRKGTIGYIKGYLMKYLAKSLVDTDNPSKIKMSPKELLFNALLKKHNVRLWNASRNFSKIMSYKNSPDYKPRDENWQCTKVDMHYDKEYYKTVWERVTEKKEKNTCGVNTVNNSGADENNFRADENFWADENSSIYTRPKEIIIPKIKSSIIIKPVLNSSLQLIEDLYTKVARKIEHIEATYFINSFA